MKKAKYNLKRKCLFEVPDIQYPKINEGLMTKGESEQYILLFNQWMKGIMDLEILYLNEINPCWGDEQILERDKDYFVSENNIAHPI